MVRRQPQQQYDDTRVFLLAMCITMLVLSWLMASKLASIVVVVSAFHIKASVSVNSNHYHTDHHQLLIVDDDSDMKIEELVKKKLHRIATGYQTHADKLQRTAEMEYELASKVEQCFMMTGDGGGSSGGSYENNSQSKNNLLLLPTKLLEKQVSLPLGLILMQIP